MGRWDPVLCQQLIQAAYRAACDSLPVKAGCQRRIEPDEDQLDRAVQTALRQPVLERLGRIRAQLEPVTRGDLPNQRWPRRVEHCLCLPDTGQGIARPPIAPGSSHLL